MTDPIKRDHHSPTETIHGSAKGEPNDARRPPKRLTLSTNIQGRQPCDVVVIGVGNNETKRLQVDLIQVLDPGLPLTSQKDWTLLRAAIEEGGQAQGYELWGFTRSMVDSYSP